MSEHSQFEEPLSPDSDEGEPDKGPITPRPSISAQVVQATERRYQAYALAEMGLSQRAIGQQLGVSQPRVSKYIRDVAEERRRSGLASTEQHRVMLLGRLNNVWRENQILMQQNRGNPQLQAILIRNADRLLRTAGYLLTLGEGLKIRVTHDIEELAKAFDADPVEVADLAERYLAELQQPRRRG